MVEFRILGPLEAVNQDGLLALGAPRQRALLAVLILRRNEAVSSDRLIDALWGEQAPASAAKIIQGYVSNLRKVLGEGVLLTVGRGYVLQTGPGQVDADSFESLVAEGRRALAEGDAGSAAQRLREALELWRGPPLADFAYESFAQADIARLEEERLEALEDRIDADLALGGHRGLAGELVALAGAHPHRERLLAQAMLALYRSGRQADALDVYRRGRLALSSDLGLDPGPQLRELEQRILIHDAGLDRAVRAEPARVAEDRARVARGHRLVAAGGALLLLAAMAAIVVEITLSSGRALRATPNSVGVISTRTNRLVAQIPVGARPGAIAVGSGSLWVANVDDQTVSRVDPTTLSTVRAIPLADPPTGIAVASGGVWVVQSNASADSVLVSRIDPQFDDIDHTFHIGNVLPGGPGSVTARGDELWVAPSSGELTRLDPATGRTVGTLEPNASPSAVDIGAGAVWVTDAEADTVTRVDPTGLLTVVPVGHEPSAIAVGAGGVWVVDSGDNAVVRIDPDTRAVTATIPVGDAPDGISVGDGSVWVANGGDGTVTRIDPVTDRKIATIAVGGSPQAVTVSGARAWVTVDAPTISPTTLAAGGGTARLDSQFDVDYMDPALAYAPISWQLLYATCAKLLNYPDKSGPAGSLLVPEVAQSLPARSADGKTYTFTIRPGFRFSPPSDEPVTAETFKDTIERTLNPVMKSPGASQYADIVGARAYMAGKTHNIAGVMARGNKLIIRLNAPDPDLSARMAEPFMCAVPPGTPIDPNGVELIPSAGPYRVAAYTPGQGIVLTRNPNYHGSRPHRLARIEVSVGIPGPRAVAAVETGTADYAVDGEITSSETATLASRYGPNSPAAAHGHQQYFVTAESEFDFYALNTHRSLFADARMRRAVNFAIDRSMLARLGDQYSDLPEQPAEGYLPPGIPGYSDVRAYPLTADPAKARQVDGGSHGTAVLYTCDHPQCLEQAQVIKADLAAIGIGLKVDTFSIGVLYTKLGTPGAPFDIGVYDWEADYPDPDDTLNLLLEESAFLPTFDDPRYRAKLNYAATLTGANRYLNYARLNADLVRNAAPWVVYGNPSSHELFSARMGCHVYSGVYGTDLAALCIKKKPA